MIWLPESKEHPTRKLGVTPGQGVPAEPRAPALTRSPGPAAPGLTHRAARDVRSSMTNPAPPLAFALAKTLRFSSWSPHLLTATLLGTLPLALAAASPVEPSFPAPASIQWAEQGWNAAERENWHHRSAGQAFGPLSWVQAVELPGNERRLMDPDHLREFGFLTK